MSEEDNSNSQPTGDNTGDAGQAPAVTQDQLNSFRNSLFADMRKMVEGIVSSTAKPKEAPEPKAAKKAESSDASDSSELKQRLERLERDKAFAEAFMGSNLAKDDLDLARRLFEAEMPDDVGAFVEQMRGRFAPRDQHPNQTQTGDQMKEPRKVTDGGSPSGTRPDAAGDDILSWTQSDYERDFAMKAKVPSNKYDVRNREYYREIRRRAEARMADSRVLIGPKGR